MNLPDDDNASDLESEEINNDRQSDEDYNGTLSDEDDEQEGVEQEYEEEGDSEDAEEDDELMVGLSNGLGSKGRINKGKILSSDESDQDDNKSQQTDDESENTDDKTEQKIRCDDDAGQLRTCAKRKMRLLSDSAEDTDDTEKEEKDEGGEDEAEQVDEEDLIAQMLEVFPHRSKKALRKSLVENSWSVCDAVATVFENRSSDDSEDSLPDAFESNKSRSTLNTNRNSGKWLNVHEYRSVSVPTNSRSNKLTNGNNKIKKRRRIEVNDSSDNEDEVEKPSKKKRTIKKVASDSEEEVSLLPKVRSSQKKKRVVAKPTTDVKWKKNLNGALESSGDESVDAEGDISSEEEETYTEEFKVQVLEFFNSASVEEMVSIEGSSVKKAEQIESLRPFNSFQDLIGKMSTTRSLGVHLVENAEDLFTQRKMLVSLMEECSKIAGNLQTLLATNLPRKDSVDLDEPESIDESEDRHVVRHPKLLRQDLKLKPYQVVGLNWLILMDQQNVNGILADEMGLGKTIQTIAFLAHLVDTGKVGPHVIVVPSSTLDNWARELRVWAPSLVVLLYFGMANEREYLRRQLLSRTRTCNIIVTTYNICISSGEDRTLFRKLPIQYAVFDEAHFLKNMTTQRYVNLMKIKATNRLLLTGTPLQNNLLELISLLSFSMPSLFMCKTTHLQRVFCMKKQRKGNENEIGTFEKDRIAHAKQIMQPFVLRRIKADVLAQLPKKIERTELCDLEPEQKKLNDELKSRLSRSFQSDSNSKLFTNNVKGAMMQLRKMANHPLLHRVRYTDELLKEMSQVMLQDEGHKEANPTFIFEDMSVMFDYEIHHLCHLYPVLKPYRLPIETIIASGKLLVLDKLLPEMKSKNDRVLIFSQFVMMLEILEIYLQHRGHSYLRLDGQTPVTDRLELIDKFNSNTDIFIFLLSTKAGGLGINLTSANTVILHDIDYNPYNDKQAEDRCHRVGQTKNVNVIRLISKNTIEEGILKCAQYKLQLEKDMISRGENEDESTASDKSILKEALNL